ncbi:Uncharacterised protein [uncultured archaeon]|nr:Uncharacterised protein [uncultured archaeon]
MDYFSLILKRIGEALQLKAGKPAPEPRGARAHAKHGLQDTTAGKMPISFAGQAHKKGPMHGEGRHSKTAIVRKAKAKGKIHHERLAAVERKIGKIAASRRAKNPAEKTNAIRTSEAIDAMPHLPGIDEIEKKLEGHEARHEDRPDACGINEGGGNGAMAKSAGQKPLAGEGNKAEDAGPGGAAANKAEAAESISEVAENAGTLRLVTDFDRLLTYIKEQGKASYLEISKELGIPLNRVDECCAILERESQIELSYPPIGPPVARAVGFTGHSAANPGKGTVNAKAHFGL